MQNAAFYIMRSLFPDRECCGTEAGIYWGMDFFRKTKHDEATVNQINQLVICRPEMHKEWRLGGV